MSALISGSLAAHGEECPPPPVTTVPHALCIAEHFVGNNKLVLRFGLEEKGDHWLVHYHSISPNIHVAGGSLKIEKSSGKVEPIGY
ncbi:MAG: hypothetical protein LBF16_04645 [Pseudomonadales bacterium]|jgi:hypothetical protein|nr:hypothetical protein [Pseudomonadales bacterium]